MPTTLKHFHAAPGNFVVHGQVTVRSAGNPLARLVARLMGAPTRDAEGPFQLERTLHTNHETWTRQFPMKCFHSTIHARGQLLIESMGPFSAASRVIWTDPFLRLELVGVKFMGLPVPPFLLPRLIAEEHAEGSRLCFNIDTHAPLIGLLFAYSGYLEIGA